MSREPRTASVVLLSLGGLTLAAVWLLPLEHLEGAVFSVHMARHMGIVAVAAPLIALGVAGSRLDPVRKLPRLFAPIPASLVELAVVWAWHAPWLHHLARHSSAGFLLEQGSFLLSGLLVWLAAFGGDPQQHERRIGAGILALLLTSMHMTLLGALLALPPRPLYAHGSHAALEDQHLGGAIMLLVGGLAYLLGGLWLAAELLRRRTGEREQPGLTKGTRA
jgi:putative membrane protein